MPCFAGFSDIPGRRAITLSKAAIEVREVAKADFVSNCTHLMRIEFWAGQHPMGTGKALTEQESRKSRAIVLEQPLKIARRHLDMSRDMSDRKRLPLFVLDEEALRGAQPRRAHPAV